LLGFHRQALTLQGKFEIHKSLKVITCCLDSPSKSGYAHPQLVASLAQLFVIKLKLHFCSDPTKGGCSRCAAPGLGGPRTSMFKMEKGSYAQKFYCYNFIHTILCKLIG